jgi:hypothetical protein
MFLGASRSLLGDSLDDSDYQKAATGNFVWRNRLFPKITY